MRRFVSFDIFDTCLCRTCGTPIVLFEQLALEVLGEHASSSNVADFRYIRIEGENNAKRKSDKEDVSLDEIYKHCDFSVITNVEKDIILQKELELEKKFLKPIAKTRELINKEREKGNNIAFISDMYLPSAFIIDLLEKYGFYQNHDYVFISGCIGKTKASRNLFRYIHKELHIPYYCWSHYGDNKINDYLIPLSLGICAHRIKTGYSYYQTEVLSKDYSLYNNSNIISAGISRSIVLENESLDIRIKFAADLIAPLYTSFVYYVLEEAEKNGIKELFYLARDGYLLYRIAESMKERFPNVHNHYIYVSRKSLYLPSLDTINDKTIESLLYDNSNLQSISEYFQVDFEKFFDDSLLKQSDKGILDSLVNNDDFLKHLETQRIRQEKLCLNYFVQEGMARNSSNCAIVDLRGTRRCQASINSILERNGYNKVYAFYLEAAFNRILPQYKNEYIAGYYGDNVYNSNFKGLLASCFVLEHYFSLSTDSRTACYTIKENGLFEPVFDKNEITSSIVKETVNINIKVCIDYAERMMSYKKLDNRSIFFVALSNLSDFMTHPSREYLKALKNIPSTENQFQTTVLIKKLGPFDIISKTTDWLDGSVIFSFGYPIYKVYYFLYRKIWRLAKTII